MPSGCVLATSLYWYGALYSYSASYIRIGDSVHISAWASTLLVQQHWAMRRPRFVGRVTGRIPRFLLFCRQLKLVISPIKGFGGKMEKVMPRLFYIYMALIFSGATIIVVSVGWIGASNLSWKWEHYIGMVTAIATFVNAVFLYITLNHQDRSFKHERFETTFFNLLDQRRKIVDAFSMSCPEWDNVSHDKVNKIYQGEACFKVAAREVQWIRDNLFVHDSYCGILDDKTTDISIDKQLESIHNELNDDKAAIYQMDKKFRCCLINQTYQITNDFFNKQQTFRGDGDKEIKISLIRFTWINGMFMEHYFRHLKQILKFLVKRQPEKKKKEYYVDFLLSQMTRYEMRIVYYYSLTNKDYKELLDKLGIVEYILHLNKL